MYNKIKRKVPFENASLQIIIILHSLPLSIFFQTVYQISMKKYEVINTHIIMSVAIDLNLETIGSKKLMLILKYLKSHHRLSK